MEHSLPHCFLIYRFHYLSITPYFLKSRDNKTNFISLCKICSVVLRSHFLAVNMCPVFCVLLSTTSPWLRCPISWPTPALLYLGRIFGSFCFQLSTSADCQREFHKFRLILLFQMFAKWAIFVIWKLNRRLRAMQHTFRVVKRHLRL